ncbi:hypothetical protein HK096_002294, partial [Nowakowskiella sp. JEL0078]
MSSGLAIENRNFGRLLNKQMNANKPVAGVAESSYKKSNGDVPQETKKELLCRNQKATLQPPEDKMDEVLNAPWSVEEDLALKQGVSLYGDDYMNIKKHLARTKSVPEVRRKPNEKLKPIEVATNLEVPEKIDEREHINPLIDTTSIRPPRKVKKTISIIELQAKDGKVETISENDIASVKTLVHKYETRAKSSPNTDLVESVTNSRASSSIRRTAAKLTQKSQQRNNEPPNVNSFTPARRAAFKAKRVTGTNRLGASKLSQIIASANLESAGFAKKTGSVDFDWEFDVPTTVGEKLKRFENQMITKGNFVVGSLSEKLKIFQAKVEEASESISVKPKKVHIQETPQIFNFPEIIGIKDNKIEFQSPMKSSLKLSPKDSAVEIADIPQRVIANTSESHPHSPIEKVTEPSLIYPSTPPSVRKTPFLPVTPEKEEYHGPVEKSSPTPRRILRNSKNDVSSPAIKEAPIKKDDSDSEDLSLLLDQKDTQRRSGGLKIEAMSEYNDEIIIPKSATPKVSKKNLRTKNQDAPKNQALKPSTNNAKLSDSTQPERSESVKLVMPKFNTNQKKSLDVPTLPSDDDVTSSFSDIPSEKEKIPKQATTASNLSFPNTRSTNSSDQTKDQAYVIIPTEISRKKTKNVTQTDGTNTSRKRKRNQDFEESTVKTSEMHFEVLNLPESRRRKRLLEQDVSTAVLENIPLASVVQDSPRRGRVNQRLQEEFAEKNSPRKPLALKPKSVRFANKTSMIQPTSNSSEFTFTAPDEWSDVEMEMDEEAIDDKKAGC